MTENMDRKESKQLDEVHRMEQPLQKWGLQIATIVFLAGGGWMTLQNIEALAEDNRKEIQVEKESTAEVREKLIRIETKQEQVIKDINEQKEISKEILRELRELKEHANEE